MDYSTPPLGTSDLAQLLVEAASDVFRVEDVTIGSSGRQSFLLRGTLATDPDLAYRTLTQRFRTLGFTPVMRERNGRIELIAIPLITAPPSGIDRIAILLFILTFISILFATAIMQAPDLSAVLRNPLVGLPFALTLLAILTAHELAHYFTARRLGVAVSPPYFIPMPISPFGTMGAVIRMKSPTQNRRQLLAVGAAGPLAGLLVAVPLLIFGLLRSRVEPLVLQPGMWLEGNSLLYLGIKYLVFGRVLPGNGVDVTLHPVAFAAWAGLLVTALNLIPAGQLDGGHIAYALLGRRTRWLNRAAVAAAVALSFVWSGWLLWALILLLLGQHSDAPLDDVTPLSPAQRALAVLMLIFFILVFTPKPITVF